MSAEQNSLSQHSCLNHKDLNSSMYGNSTLSTIDPIHTGSELSFLSVKHKLSPPKPAFGTSSSRVINELKGNKQSDIVAYSRINYEKNEKYHDRYEQIKAKLTPFMSTCGRFGLNRIRNPGPGQYSIPQVFKAKQENLTKQGPMFCPFKRWESQESKLSPLGAKSQQKMYFVSLSNKENNRQANAYDIQQRIKEKRQEIKEKMLVLKQKMKRPQEGHKFQLKRMGFSQNQGKTSEAAVSPKNKSPKSSNSPTKQVNLRQTTSKYLPKLHYEFEREQYRIVGQIKNFKQRYNHQAVFVSKNDSPFSSYIPKSENPGPGYYEKRMKKMSKRRESSKMDQFLI